MPPLWTIVLYGCSFLTTTFAAVWRAVPHATWAYAECRRLEDQRYMFDRLMAVGEYELAANLADSPPLELPSLKQVS